MTGVIGGTKLLGKSLGSLTAIFLSFAVTLYSFPIFAQDLVPSKPIVYFIADAHDQLEAQQSIRQILRTLIGTQNVRHVFFEGGSTDLERRFYDTSLSHTVNQEIWEKLFSEGWLSGLERYALEAPLAVRFSGIEEEALYLKNLNALQQIFRQTNIRFQPAIPERATGALRKALAARHAFEEKRLGLVPYMRELRKAAAKAGLEPEELSGAKNANEFLSQLEHLETRIFESLAEACGTEGKKTLQEAQEFRLAGQLLNLELAGDNAPKALSTDFSALFKKHPELKMSVQAAKQHYRLALERDKILARNLVRNVRHLRREGKNQFAVVAGGFHQDAILQALRKANIDSVVLHPKISSFQRLDYRHRILPEARHEFTQKRFSPTAELFPPVEGALPVYLSKKFKSVFHARARVAARSLGLLGSLRGSAAGETVAIQRARRAAEIIKKQMAGRMELGRLIDGEPTSWEGAIYEGRIDGRPAAIKISFPIPIGSNRREDVETEATLSREEMASRLIRTDQRHLIHALGSGSVTTNSEKIIWLALELLKGQTLRDYIHHRDMPEKEGEFVLIARCFIQILRALEEFHKLGLIHRDIKPENIWLKSMCEALVHAVLMDFGLTVTRNTVLSQTNDFAGTANYMPPEYIYHDDSENPLSAQGDIWSTGVALFEALTGTLAFSGITPEQIFTRIIRGNSRITQINRHVPPALDAITARMMAPEPEERYQTAGEAASALELWLPKTVTASSLGIQAGKARPRSEQNLVENILLSVRMRSAEHQTAGRMA